MKKMNVKLYPMESAMEFSKALVEDIKPLSIIREKGIPVLVSMVHMGDIGKYGFYLMDDDTKFCNQASYNPEIDSWGVVLGGQQNQLTVTGIYDNCGIKEFKPMTVPVYKRKIGKIKVYVIDLKEK